ncbi:MAG: hypothetical protein J7L89_03965 [Bacteroidales bacterium]|nr:hypothetical protein [Bacteroidales bacterium]
MKNTYLAAITLWLAATCQVDAQTGKVLQSFDTPGQFCTGLTWDGHHLWVADRKADKIYQVNPKNGKTVRTIESPGYFPTGLTWDGRYLWNADIRGRSDISENRNGMFFRIDPKTLTVIQTLKSPSPSPRGIAWDGKYIWSVDDVKDVVIQSSTVDGSTMRSFPAPAKDPQGIAFDGHYLWITDRILDEIYMVDPATGFVILIADAPAEHITDITYDGKNLWCLDIQEDKIYKLAVHDGVRYVKKDEQEQEVVFTHYTKNFGPGKLLDLQVHIALPENRINQELIGDFIFKPQPAKIVTDQWGQKTALFAYKNLPSGTQISSEVTTRFKSWNVRYFIYPEDVGSIKEIPADIKGKYVVDNEKYQINDPLIKSTLRRVVGDEQNVYWVIRKIHQYLIGHLHYLMDGYWDTAPTVLRNGHGSCSEYTFTFIALCRAAGIPARYVGSTWNRKDKASMDNVYHRWVEVYLPNYGWIPTDPTHGDRATPRDQAYPIGFLSKDALITTQSGGGSETMQWTYNSNEFYTTELKTNLNIENFADWLPLNNN